MTKAQMTLNREIQKKALERTPLIPVSTKIKPKTIKLQRPTSKVSDDHLYITNGSKKNGRNNNKKFQKKEDNETGKNNNNNNKN
jgi:hypothetical protein